MCGDTALKSCKVGGRPHQSKDETGLMLASCRHVFILKALDMYRGEIYEYPYILQVFHGCWLPHLALTCSFQTHDRTVKEF